MKTLLPLGLLLLLLPQVATANAIVRVNAMNYPVWKERGQEIIPLLPGSVLSNGDLIKTGAGGRAWLSMADGSVVKLGESAQFRIESARYHEGENTILKAAFNVIRQFR